MIMNNVLINRIIFFLEHSLNPLVRSVGLVIKFAIKNHLI